MLFARLLRCLIKKGSLILIDAAGRRHVVGEAANDCQPVKMKLHISLKITTPQLWLPSLPVEAIHESAGSFRF